MKRLRKISHILPLIVLFVSVLPAQAEVTRTLREEIPATGQFAVENLAGIMKVTSGSGKTVVVTATVHAENDEVANSIHIERVTTKDGRPALRVVYPTDNYGKVRYPSNRGSDSSFMSRLFGGSQNTSTTYAGRKVRVSSNDGILMYADLEVQVPAGSDGKFLNTVGSIEASSAEGSLSFAAASGNIHMRSLRGRVEADTGSGNVDGGSLEGTFEGNTGSGNIVLSAFRGEKADCSTGSGNIKIEAVDAHTLNASTGSGNVRILDADVEEFEGGTGSGNIELEADGGRLATMKASTGSGNVTLRLAGDASFEAMTDTGSGDVVSRFDDAEPIKQGKEIIGYRRGSQKSRIEVSTGSGNVTLGPA